MGETQENRGIENGLASAMARVGMGAPQALHRLTGGATMESWRFSSDGEDFVLRRAPSLEFMAGRPFGHDVEAAVIRAAHGKGVTAPEVVVELVPDDGIGSGFVMRALPGTPDPRAILAMEDPDQLLREVAADLARIHSLKPADLPDVIPTMDYAEGVAGLREQFEEAGGDRPIIALGLKWLMDNLPVPVEPVLNHGDYRLGNILCKDSHLTGVLDWELVHFGDRHEDLAFGCMAVWRFSRYDRPALGLGSLEDYFAAYEAAGGAPVDRERFRFWSIYRTVWWALGCIRMADFWRRGEDRMLERVVISRRTSENELDLLMLLDDDLLPGIVTKERLLAEELDRGEANDAEIAEAVSEWLATIKDQMEGHDRFQLAVARNALGMLARGYRILPRSTDPELARDYLAGRRDMTSDPTITRFRRDALDKLEADVPKYPALAVARQKWTGED
ncbi:phosphotransferase family protein [Parerythrobacter aestuarii]|uniref:phosphotransferase family protein n=1 Tax=Parerythrobacter aestuarii TaxID=3020909 RepID=UPI0024DEB5C8|nr:phosphotransferase family protein [Parerythrobacter aestuarii]